MMQFKDVSLLQLIAFIAIVAQTYCTVDPCIEQQKCACKLKDDRVIDLTPLASNDKFLKAYYQLGNTSMTYYFHPCTDAVLVPDNLNPKVTNNCKNPTSLCRLDSGKDTSILTDLGNAEDFKFSDDIPKSLIFTHKKNGSLTATIRLECVQDATADSILAPDVKIDPSGLILFSPHACVTHAHQGLSLGWILLILLFVTLAVYFIGGALVLHYLRGAQGKEIIPNVEFWVGLPGLMKDGLIFLLNGCRPTTITSAETYDRI